MMQSQFHGNLFSPNASSYSMIRRRMAVAILLMFVLSTSQAVFANSTGKTGASTSGCTCHSNSSPISPSLSGLPWGAGGYTPGSTYSLIWDGGPHVSGDGGFNLDASAGTWSNLGPAVQLSNGELTHSSDSLRSWSADWTAPTAGSGDVDFDLAVLYANGNSQNTGDSWGTGTWTLSESGPTNNPPTASNVQYVPSDPTKGTGLAVDYDYYDADGDSEQGTEIRWVLDGLNVGALDDQKVVGQDWLYKNQVWECTVTVKDGQDQGEPVELGPITIGNTIPIARDLEITPENPVDTDELRLDYEYFDLDGEGQQSTQIRWYLDGGRITELDDEDRVSSLMIRSGDEWEASVTPHDGDDYGNTVYTGVIVIGSSNNPPSATAYVSPVGNAHTDDALQVNVGWTDPDGDTIVSTEIRWFRNDAQYSAYNDMTNVLSESTSKGDTWMAKVRVSDGLLWSDWVESDEIVILNTAPEVSGIKMLPEGSLTTANNLSVEWNQTDLDGDAEMNSQIRWWVNGEWVREYDGWTSIPYTETLRDQSWSVQVVPSDGEDLGTSMKTPSRFIENTAPSIPEISLGNSETGYLGSPENEPSPPTLPADSQSPLAVIGSSSDLDDEPVTFVVTWARNGFSVPDLNDELTVPTSRLEPGQIWTVTVISSDPWGLNSSNSISIEIANLNPLASYIISPQPPISGAEIVFDASQAIDVDGTIVSWLWQIDDTSFTGQIISTQLGPGIHQISLMVVDEMGGVGSTEGELNFGEASSVQSLNAEMSGSQVELNWEWDGAETVFHIYRSSSPFYLDEIPSEGVALFTEIDSIGSTTENSWSETAPVASDLYYVVTLEVRGHEVLWMNSGQNVASVDASSAPQHVDMQPTGEIGTLATPLTILMLLFGLSSIGLTLYSRRRDGQ